MKRTTITILLLCIIKNLFSQHTEEKSFSFPGDLAPSLYNNYAARDLIEFKPGTAITPENFSGNTFTAYIDPALLFPPSDATYKTPQGAITTDPTKGSLVGSIQSQFNVGPTGSATYTIPIECPAGVNGMQPNISLVYSSQGGDGIAGLGWNIAGVSNISKIPKSIYFDNQVSALNWDDLNTLSLDGVRLITSDGVNFYAENNPKLKITKYSDADNGVSFKVENGNGIVSYYTEKEQIMFYESLGDEDTYFTCWYITKQENKNGAFISYTYDKTRTVPVQGWHYIKNYRLSSIFYGHSACGIVGEIDFTYKSRTTTLSKYISGILIEQEKLLDYIEVKGLDNSKIFRTYQLIYGNNGVYDKLQSITLINETGETLAPTKFVWSEEGGYSKVGEEYIAPLSENRAERPIYGDFDADGMTDFIVYDEGHVDLFLAYKLYGTVGFYKKYAFDAYGNNHKGVVPADLNGDGKLDLISITEASNGTYRYNYYFFDGETFSKGSSSGGYYGFNETKKDNDVLIGDFNGDGKHDVLIKSTQKVYNQYGGVIASGGGISSWGNETLNPFIKNKYLIDFTGNGKTNLCILETGKSIIYELEGNSFIQKFSTPYVKYNQPGHIGDYNGDHLMDFLVQTSDSKNYFFLFSTSTGFVKKDLPDLNLYHKIFVTDFNRDGKSDIIVCGKYNISTNKYIFKIGINKVNNFEFEEVNSNITVFAGSGGLSFFDYMSFNDFDGDGRSELCYDRYVDVMMYKSFTDKDNLLVKTIKNGMDKSVNIEYSTLSDDGVYSNNNFLPVFPVVSMKIPLNVVKKVSISGGYNQSIHYDYGDICLHRQGKGFLGFLGYTVYNSTTGEKVEYTNTLNTAYYALLPSTQVKGKIKSKEVNILSNAYSIVYNGSKRYKLSLATQNQEDLLTGIKIKTTYPEYDPYNNPKKIVKQYLGTDISEETSLNYIAKGAWCPNKVQSKNNYPEKGGRAPLFQDCGI